MRPPAGRIEVGSHVTDATGRAGEVIRERLVATNGAWRYVVRWADGTTGERLDYELRRAEADRDTRARGGHVDSEGVSR